MCMFGLQHHLLLARDLLLVNLDQRVSRVRQLGSRAGLRTLFAAPLDQTLCFCQLVPFELARLVGFLEHVAEIGVVVLRARNLQSGGERNRVFLNRLDQSLLAFLKQKDGREHRPGPSHLSADGDHGRADPGCGRRGASQDGVRTRARTGSTARYRAFVREHYQINHRA